MLDQIIHKRNASLFLFSVITTVVILSEVVFAQVIINEVFPNPVGTEAGNEWVEIYNNDESPISLDNLVLQEAANPATEPDFNNFATLSGILNPGEFLVANGSSLNNPGDIVRLYNTSSDTVLDQVAYGNANDGDTSDNALLPAEGESIGRLPDGQDTDIDSNDFYLFTFPTNNSTNGALVFVDDDGVCDNKNPCFSTIQDGITNVAENGTVNVSAGIYDESITIDKSMTLRGPGINAIEPATISYSGCDTRIVTIKANNVTVEGLILEDAGSNCFPVIQINPGISGVVIQNNEISFGFRGVTLTPGANNNQIINNIIHDNDVGVRIGGATDNIISGNNISNNFYGIELTEAGGGGGLGVDPSGNVSNNLIEQNNIFENGYGIYGSSTIFFSELNIFNNTISNNFITGVYFEGVSNSGILTIDSNEIASNSESGIFLGELSGAIITNNNILNNGITTGLVVLTAIGNEAHFNKIAGNGVGVENLDIVNDFNATQNWWGDSTGPFDENLNPDGQGDSIIGNVIFIPWCTNEVCNDAPFADSQSISTNEDTTIDITLTGSDVDGDLLNFIVVSGPTKGTLSGTPPNLTYTPNANENGADSFTFVTNDGSLNSTEATVDISIESVNDALTSPSLVSPVNNALINNATPEFSWTPSTDVDNDEITYTLFVDNDTDFSSPVIEQIGLITTSFTPETDLTSDAYSWKVAANDGTVDAASAIKSFTILAPTTPIHSETAAADSTTTINATATANTTLVITTKSTDSTEIFIAPTIEPSANVGVLGLDKFIEITVSNVSALIFPIEIRMYYTDAEIAAAGVDESSLRIYFFNETNNSWQIEPNSSVDTVNNFVFAFVNHLSTYGAYGSQSSVPTLSLQAPSLSGGCLVDYSLTSALSVNAAPSSSIAVPVVVSNKGTCNAYVGVSAAVPSGWLARDETTKLLRGSESETVNIIITLPNDAVTSDITFSGTIYYISEMGKTNSAITSVDIVSTTSAPSQPSPISPEGPAVTTGAVTAVPSPVSRITGLVTINPVVSTGVIIVILLGAYIGWWMLTKTSKLKRKR